MVVVQETLGVLTGVHLRRSGLTALDDGHGYLPAPALAVANSACGGVVVRERRTLRACSVSKSLSYLPITMVATALPRTLMRPSWGRPRSRPG